MPRLVKRVELLLGIGIPRVVDGFPRTIRLLGPNADILSPFHDALAIRSHVRIFVGPCREPEVAALGAPAWVVFQEMANVESAKYAAQTVRAAALPTAIGSLGG